jgi:hypothetical protein
MCIQCAKKVLQILDEMEKKGDFEGLTKEEKEYERMEIGLRIRSNMPCPSHNQTASKEEDNNGRNSEKMRRM